MVSDGDCKAGLGWDLEVINTAATNRIINTSFQSLVLSGREGKSVICHRRLSRGPRPPKNQPQADPKDADGKGRTRSSPPPEPCLEEPPASSHGCQLPLVAPNPPAAAQGPPGTRTRPPGTGTRPLGTGTCPHGATARQNCGRWHWVRMLGVGEGGSERSLKSGKGREFHSIMLGKTKNRPAKLSKVRGLNTLRQLCKDTEEIGLMNEAVGLQAVFLEDPGRGGCSMADAHTHMSEDRQKTSWWETGS
ncbi:uncharacterized protein [Haliaeetus albicilla]|uniref:uncharacterized protein n=1 Tax=Haliaeetus albicilla TaxID=8969 RepID=UPI0037E90C49